MDKRKIAQTIYTLVCDDIRHEVGNKLSLMGLYSDIVVKETPTILPKISLAIIFKGIKYKIKTINIALKQPSGDVIDLPEFKMPQQAKIGSNHNIDICIAPLKIANPGMYIWEIRIDGEKKPSITHEINVRTPDAH
jgi:hypothetical protein